MEKAIQIISFGEALIDFKQQDGLNFKGYEGGSPMNVAIAASRLGAGTGFGGQVSTDLFGEALRNHLEKNEVDTHYLLSSDAPTTLAFVAEIGGDAHFSFISNGAADTLYDPQPRPELPESVKFLQFGSKSLLDQPTSSSISDIVAMHQGKCAVVFDPNVRPALISSKEEYLRDLNGWLELSTIVKVSTQDLEWLYPDKKSAEVASDWLELGPSVVIITNGGEGVTLFRESKDPLRVDAPSVEVVDTVGAGDTFTGSMMVALLDKGVTEDFTGADAEVWRDVLSFAAAAAAFNCTRDGADPPTREELSAFREDGGQRADAGAQA